MPERTHATAYPQPALSIGSRRTDPIAARRSRRSKPPAEAPPSRARGNDHQTVNAAPFSEQIQRSGRARPIPKSNSVRAHPKAALRPAVAQRLLAKSSATADLQVPNRKQRRASLSASTGDQKWPRAVRRPHTHRSRADHPAGNARAHTRHSLSSASAFDRLAPNRPHSCAPEPPIETAGRGAALARARKRPSNS